MVDNSSFVGAMYLTLVIWVVAVLVSIFGGEQRLVISLLIANFGSYSLGAGLAFRESGKD